MSYLIHVLCKYIQNFRLFYQKIKYLKFNLNLKKYLSVYKFTIFVLDLFSLDNDSLRNDSLSKRRTTK